MSKKILQGGEHHQQLGDYAIAKLKAEDITNIVFEANVGIDKKCNIDILGIKNGRRIGVECILQVQPKSLVKRIPQLNVDRLIFCVPDEREAEKLKPFGKEVWVAGISRPRSITVSLSDTMEDRLRLWLRKRGDISRIVEEALELWLDRAAKNEEGES